MLLIITVREMGYSSMPNCERTVVAEVAHCLISWAALRNLLADFSIVPVQVDGIVVLVLSTEKYWHLIFWHNLNNRKCIFPTRPWRHTARATFLRAGLLEFDSPSVILRLFSFLSPLGTKCLFGWAASHPHRSRAYDQNWVPRQKNLPVVGFVYAN